MVPDEGIEPPTFGLQNRCTTAVLIRRRDPHIAQGPRKQGAKRSQMEEAASFGPFMAFLGEGGAGRSCRVQGGAANPAV